MFHNLGTVIAMVTLLNYSALGNSFYYNISSGPRVEVVSDGVERGGRVRPQAEWLVGGGEGYLVQHTLVIHTNNHDSNRSPGAPLHSGTHVCDN